jgi:hypothetical protein
MSNLLYTKGEYEVRKNNVNWETAVICVLLERSTSSYVPDADHPYLDSFTTGGGVEIDVVSYARRTLTSPNINQNDALNQVELDCSNIAFGSLEAGQTVKALIVYVQIGGDDATPEDDILLARIDTDSGGILPAALGGGAFNITVNGQGLMRVKQGT